MDRTQARPVHVAPRTACPTCRQRHPRPEPDGWGERMDWWDCWQCSACETFVCNMPASAGQGKTLPCYVKHSAAMHHELYEPGTVGD